MLTLFCLSAFGKCSRSAWVLFGTVQHYAKLIHRRLVEKEGKSINFICGLLKWLFCSINQLYENSDCWVSWRYVSASESFLFCRALSGFDWCASVVGFLPGSQRGIYSEKERIFFSCFMSSDCLARFWFLPLFFCGEIWPVLSVFCLVCPGSIISEVFSTWFFNLKRKIQ